MKTFAAICVFALLAVCYAITLDALKSEIVYERRMIITESGKTVVSIENEIHSVVQGLHEVIDDKIRNVENGSAECKKFSTVLEAIQSLYDNEHFFKECEMKTQLDNLRSHDYILAELYDRALALDSCSGSDCQSKIDDLDGLFQVQRKAVSNEFLQILDDCDVCTTKQGLTIEGKITATMTYWEKCEKRQ